MRRRSLKVPWKDFAAACEQLIEWRSFALWVRAIIDAERRLPDWLEEQIDRRCPGLIDRRRKSANHETIWLEISAWADNQIFVEARSGRWLDALHYYSGRDSRSEQVWTHWTETEAAWRKRRPTAYPSFEEWHEQALNRTDSPRPDDDLAALVQQYMEWEAFAFWSRAIVECEGKIPAHLASALEQRCPGFLEQIRRNGANGGEYSTWFWRELLAWIEAHTFADAKKDHTLHAVRTAARSHLRGERIAEFWVWCSFQWRRTPPDSYPTFEQWLQAADSFVIR